MTVYISADIEGITGITHVDETNAAYPNYAQFRVRAVRFLTWG